MELAITKLCDVAKRSPGWDTGTEMQFRAHHKRPPGRTITVDKIPPRAARHWRRWNPRALRDHGGVVTMKDIADDRKEKWTLRSMALLNPHIEHFPNFEALKDLVDRDRQTRHLYGSSRWGKLRRVHPAQPRRRGRYAAPNL